MFYIYYMKRYVKKNYRKKTRYTKKRSSPLKSTRKHPNSEVMTCIQRQLARVQFGAGGTQIYSTNDYQGNTTLGSSLQTATPVAPGTNPPYSLGFCATLINVPNATRFTNLYDKYRILGYKITIRPVQNVVDNQLTSIIGGGTWYITYDYDDIIPLTTMQQMVSREKILVKQGYRQWSYTVRPRVLIGAQQTLGNTATLPAIHKVSPWLDCLQTGSAVVSQVPHNGIKFMYQPDMALTAGETVDFNLTIEYKLEFKDIIANP